jgi:hypothetical protein
MTNVIVFSRNTYVEVKFLMVVIKLTTIIFTEQDGNSDADVLAASNRGNPTSSL